MNYELAKKLKDAGFPQKGKGTHEIDPKADTSTPYTLAATRNDCYIPTLSELIEACKPFRLFEIKYLNVYIHDTIGWVSFFEGEKGLYKGHGSTPEEAVALLWLAIHTP